MLDFDTHVLGGNLTQLTFILAGDFNRTFLPMIQSVVKSFNLKPTVTFPTRGDRILDQIFTNLGDYFSDPIRLPPFGLSDHVAVYMGSSARSALKPKHKIIKSRDKRPIQSLNMHARSSIVIYSYISRKKLNAFSVVRYALFFLIVVTVKVSLKLALQLCMIEVRYVRNSSVTLIRKGTINSVTLTYPNSEARQ